MGTLWKRQFWCKIRILRQLRKFVCTVKLHALTFRNFVYTFFRGPPTPQKTWNIYELSVPCYHLNCYGFPLRSLIHCPVSSISETRPLLPMHRTGQGQHGVENCQSRLQCWNTPWASCLPSLLFIQFWTWLGCLLTPPSMEDGLILKLWMSWQYQGDSFSKDNWSILSRIIL